MKTSVENLSPTRVKLTVNVPFEELKPSVEAATKKIAQQVQIPGFRKGKVPTRLVEQRFGRPVIMQEAVNDSVPELYQQAVAEAALRPVAQPELEVAEVPGLDGTDEGDLVLVFELDVRPQIDLPDFSSVEVEIDEPVVDDDAVETRLTALRERFGTLKSVDRPAQDGDFVSLDMVATIDGEEIETVEGVSYQIGEGNMLEGLDEALTGLSADETTTFTAPLAGGERAGEDAEVTVTAKSVKERELPEADDEFAELASEFDTIEELKDSLREEAEKNATANRVALASAALVEKLMEDLEVPLPEKLVEDEIRTHLEHEGKEDGDPHGDEIREETEQAVKNEFIMDAILEGHPVTIEQDDLTAYFTNLSVQYRIEPSQLIQMFAQSGQMEYAVRELQRLKALNAALAEVTVKNKNGETLDLGLDAGEAEGSDDAEAADGADEAKAESADEAKAEGADEVKAEDADEAKAEDADEAKAESADEVKAESADEAKAEDADEAKAADDATTEKAKTPAKASESTRAKKASSSSAKSSTAKSSSATSGNASKKSSAKKTEDDAVDAEK